MLESFIIVFLGRLVGGVVGGIAGFGGMMVSLPILSLGLPASMAVLVCCLSGAPGYVQLAWLYRKNVVWSDMRWLWIGCLPGCILGTLTLKAVPVHYLQLMISIMIACFVLLELFHGKTSWSLPDSIFSLLFTGLASGFAHSSVSVVGVPIGIFILLKHWDKDRARSSTAMFFFMSGWITVLVQWLAGLYTMDLLGLSLVGMTAACIGQYAGFRIGRSINQVLFVRIVMAFLIFSAVTLCYKSLT